MDTWNVLFVLLFLSLSPFLWMKVCVIRNLLALEQGTALLHMWANDNVCLSYSCSAAFFPALCVKVHLSLVPELSVGEHQEHICYLDPTDVIGARNILICFIQDFMCLNKFLGSICFISLYLP